MACEWLQRELRPWHDGVWDCCVGFLAGGTGREQQPKEAMKSVDHVKEESVWLMDRHGAGEVVNTKQPRVGG